MRNVHVTEKWTFTCDGCGEQYTTERSGSGDWARMNNPPGWIGGDVTIMYPPIHYLVCCDECKNAAIRKKISETAAKAYPLMEDHANL